MAAETITTTASVALAVATTARQAVIFQNISDTDIYIGQTNAVTATVGANTGIRVKAGGDLTISTEVGNNRYSVNAAWFAIHAGTGDKTLLVNTL